LTVGIPAAIFNPVSGYGAESMPELDFHSILLFRKERWRCRVKWSIEHNQRLASFIGFPIMIERPDTLKVEGEESARGRLLTPRWYALYTRSRFEKKMLGELTDRSIEVFLPMREILSRWKDRKKRVWIPLFPGYIFVNHVDTPENRFRILNIPGAVRFVGNEGHALPIPEEQIQYVRRFLESSIAIDPYPYIRVGCRVEVIAGPLKGIQGILVEKRGRFRFVIQVDLIRQAVSVAIDASDVRPI
jgi:transcriptional antiterminator NusG